MAKPDNDQSQKAGLTEGLNVHLLTTLLMNNLLWDLPLSPPELVDFGVDTADHYRALKAALVNEGSDQAPEADTFLELSQRIVELDQAYGNGPKLTAFVKKYAPQYSGLIFCTSWDVIAEGLTEAGKRRLGR